jgi:putative transposase
VALRRDSAGACADGLDEGTRRAANGQQTMSNSVHHCPSLSTRKARSTCRNTRRAQVEELGRNGLLIRGSGVRIPPGAPPRRAPRGGAPHGARTQRNRLWVADITEHPILEGRLYCCLVYLLAPRGGLAIDSSPTAALVTNALGMAIGSRNPNPGTLIHSDHGTQFTSWVFTHRAKASGLVPSMGSIGDCYDNALIESFWSRMQVELLDRQRWLTRVELANAIFDYLEVFHNRQRRHSALQILTPIEFENDRSGL